MTKEQIEGMRTTLVRLWLEVGHLHDPMPNILCDMALLSLESVRSEALLEKCAVLFETFAEHGMIAYMHGEKSPNAILCESAAKELRALSTAREDVHSTELLK